jgi:GT2 family glycosyltransferase
LAGAGKPLVSVVILSYNRPQYLAQALESILAQTYPALEVLVVDNPSSNSDTISRMVEKHPSVKLIAMSENAGYTGGMNEGIRQSQGDYIYLTEDDMVSDRNAIAAMVQYMEHDPQAGIVSGALYDNTGALICGGGFIRLDAVFSQFLIGRNTPVPPPLCGPFCATFATGAMIMLRQSVVRELGPFRPDFFMYYEDVELCQRVMASGKMIVIVPAARACTFAESYAVQTTRAVDFHKMKNFFALYVLHAPLRKLPEFFLRYGGINLLRAIATDRKAALLLLKAELWMGRNLLRLLRERNEMRRVLRRIRAQQVGRISEGR